jgi:hypothetical protein
MLLLLLHNCFRHGSFSLCDLMQLLASLAPQAKLPLAVC